MYYKNRIDAAKSLMPFLEKYKDKEGVVLAIPRGGVPLGEYIASQLNLPLDLMMVKKIGHPFNKEYAIGAVSLENDFIVDSSNVPIEYLSSEIASIRETLKKKYIKFSGNKLPISIKNKIVIVVDDGIATGNTIIAGLKMLQNHNPDKIVVAVPVAPPQVIGKIKAEADEVICPKTPADFLGVGQFYFDFSEVTDEEVVQMLKETARKIND